MSDWKPTRRICSAQLRTSDGPEVRPTVGVERLTYGSLANEVAQFLRTQPIWTEPDRTGDRGDSSRRWVLLPYGSSAVTTYAVQAAIVVAPAYRARVHVLHVRPWDDPRTGPPIGDPMAEATALTCQAVADLTAHGVTARGAIRRAGPTGIASQILDEATEIGAAAIVLATRPRRVLWAMARGSISLPVIRQAPCPVILVHPPPRPKHHAAQGPPP